MAFNSGKQIKITGKSIYLTNSLEISLICAFKSTSIASNLNNLGIQNTGMYLLICTHGDIVSFPIHWPEKCMGICLLLLSVCSLIVYKKISMDGNVTAIWAICLSFTTDLIKWSIFSIFYWLMNMQLRFCVIVSDPKF